MQNSKIISKALLEKYIDFNPKNKKKQKIELMVSPTALNLESGSEDSNEFLEGL